MLEAVSHFEKVRIAAVQATPVILDAEASVEKAIGLLEEAAAEGARLAVLPEAFVSLYPSNAWARQGAGFGGFDRFWKRMWEESLDVPGPLVDRLAETCRRLDMHCAVGVNERESERPGTIYNTLLLIGPAGLMAKHRKLMPTPHERLYYAPTADDSDGWLATVRHIAIESGAFVVSIPQFIPRAAFPADFPAPCPEQEVFGRGGGAMVEPTWGDVVAGPLYDREGTVIADCDLRDGLHAKRWFDSVGHYSREDVLDPGQSADGHLQAPSPASAEEPA